MLSCSNIYVLLSPFLISSFLLHPSSFLLSLTRYGYDPDPPPPDSMSGGGNEDRWDRYRIGRNVGQNVGHTDSNSSAAFEPLSPALSLSSPPSSHGAIVPLMVGLEGVGSMEALVRVEVLT